MTSEMMKDKVVIVTGAGGGIGRDIALLMAAEGAKVIVNDIGVSLSGEGGSASPAQETKRMIEEMGGVAETCAESVSTWSSAGRIVQAAMDHFGRLDAVVNNAGILRDKMFHKMSEEEWRAVIDVHLHGSFFVSRAAADIFRNQLSGAFVHMSSTSGLIGNFGQANYAAAKMGIVGLSKSIALDMHRYNVRSNCIAPSAWSRMTNAIPAKTPDQEVRVERLKKMTPAKNAPLTVFLASDAANNVTGQIFAVRMNEIFLMSANRPVRGLQRAEGWTPTSICDELIPALRPMFTPLDRTQDVFPWDPV